MVEDKTINMFVLADLHVGSRHHTAETFAEGLANMHRMDPHASYLINGDITTSGKVTQYQDVWQILDAALPTDADTIITLGNHDVRGPYSHDWNNYQESDPEYFREIVVPEYVSNYLQPRQGTNELYFAVIRGCYQFVVLNSEKGLKDSAYLSIKQLAWLDAKLTNGTQAGLVNIVVVHQALRDTHWRSNFGGGFGIQDAVVKAILRRHRNTFVLSGHIHNGFGVCEVIPRPYGTCIDQPAYTVSENGYVGQGLGYYCHFSKQQMVFEAWDFVAMQHLSEYDMTIPTTALASVQNAGGEVQQLLHLQYNQTLFNNPDTDDATAAPAVALFPAAVRAKMNQAISDNESDATQVELTPKFDFKQREEYFTERDRILGKIVQNQIRLKQVLTEDVALETHLAQTAELARLNMVLAHTNEFSDSQLDEEQRLSDKALTV
jgi:hypothetical protein